MRGGGPRIEAGLLCNARGGWRCIITVVGVGGGAPWELRQRARKQGCSGNGTAVKVGTAVKCRSHCIPGFNLGQCSLIAEGSGSLFWCPHMSIVDALICLYVKGVANFCTRCRVGISSWDIPMVELVQQCHKECCFHGAE